MTWPYAVRIQTVVFQSYMKTCSWYTSYVSRRELCSPRFYRYVLQLKLMNRKFSCYFKYYYETVFSRSNKCKL